MAHVHKTLQFEIWNLIETVSLEILALRQSRNCNEALQGVCLYLCHNIQNPLQFFMFSSPKKEVASHPIHPNPSNWVTQNKPANKTRLSLSVNYLIIKILNSTMDVHHWIDEAFFISHNPHVDIYTVASKSNNPFYFLYILHLRCLLSYFDCKIQIKCF